MLARFSSRFVRSVQPQTDGGKIRAPLRRLDEISLRLSGSSPQEPDVRKRAEPNHKKQGARKKTRPRAKDRSGTRDRGAGERDARKKNNAPAREGPERNARPRRGGTGRAEENATYPRAKGRCGTRNRGAGEQGARKKNSAPAREGPVRNARPRRGGTGRAEEKQRARARRAGAERKTAARGNVTRCGRGQAQDQWSRRTATKPSRTPITVKMAGFRLWAKACDCGSTSLKVT